VDAENPRHRQLYRAALAAVRARAWAGSDTSGEDAELIEALRPVESELQRKRVDSMSVAEIEQRMDLEPREVERLAQAMADLARAGRTGERRGIRLQQISSRDGETGVISLTVPDVYLDREREFLVYFCRALIAAAVLGYRRTMESRRREG
jgi:hypothetical protein